MRSTWMIAALAFVAGCSQKQAETATAAATTADSGMKMAADTGMHSGGMSHDADQATGGTGVPAGYVGITDHPDAKIADAKYTPKGGQWEVLTGPAHLLYAAKDSGSGGYAVTATIEQLAKPAHPEAYGLFFGGSALDNPSTEKYGYFLVRGSGEYLIKARDGAKTKDVVAWKASPDVPTQDAAGKAKYVLLVHFAPDTAHFTVNGKLIAAVPRSELPTTGIFGLRINHNLHLLVTPPTLSH